MAMYKCNRNNGNKVKETLLWTNPYPNNSFSNQRITTSDFVGNYDAVKIVIKKYREYDTVWEYIVPKSLVRGSAGAFIGTDYYTRGFFSASTTDLVVGSCSKNGSTYNEYIIPTEIYGVKY